MKVYAQLSGGRGGRGTARGAGRITAARMEMRQLQRQGMGTLAAGRQALRNVRRQQRQNG